MAQISEHEARGRKLFPWTNDEWGKQNLAWVRLAAVIVKNSDAENDEALLRMTEDERNSLVDGITGAIDRIDDLNNVCWGALASLEQAAERVGV